MSEQKPSRPLVRIPNSEPKQEEIPDLAQLAVATVGALITGGLYFGIGARLQVIPPLVVIIVLILTTVPALGWIIVKRRLLPYRLGRLVALTHVVVLGALLVFSLARLVMVLPTYSQGRDLLRDGALLWIINVLIFTTEYWEIDGNGPVNRMRSHHEASDFMFPQQQGGNRTGWAPGFIDYLFLAFCFSTALSPADSMPLTKRGKLLVMAQASISLIIIVLLIGRSVNILA
jgi:hypothetical protein